MANHKYILRISKIIRRIKRGDFPSTAVLLAYLSEHDFDINKRTLSRDFKTILELFDLEVSYNRIEKGYQFNEDDLNCYAQKFNETLDLFSSLSIVGKSKNVISFENRKSNGIEFMPAITEAIKSRNVLCFQYFKYHSKSTSNRLVHPYLIKESQGRWYLVARDKKDEVIKTFGLDRMSLVFKESECFEGSSIDFEKMFSNYFGVINIGKAQKIELKIKGANAFFIKNYPLHPSQSIEEETKDWITFSLSLAITEDFVMELMKYGASVSILSPLVLKNKLKEEYTKALNNIG